MLILASQSPRRQEILRNAGLAFETRVPDIPEVRAEGEDARSYALRLAREKSIAVPAGNGDFVIAADTIVLVDDHVLEKPHSAADAARMLRLLAGREHSVITAVCVRHGGALRSHAESTLVRFVAMSDAEIEAYAASGEPLDKAGGYAIQGLASKYIDRIEGCYFNVVGLPVSLVWRLLRESGYSLALG